MMVDVVVEVDEEEDFLFFLVNRSMRKRIDIDV